MARQLLCTGKLFLGSFNGFYRTEKGLKENFFKCRLIPLECLFNFSTSKSVFFKGMSIFTEMGVLDGAW